MLFIFIIRHPATFSKTLMGKCDVCHMRSFALFLSQNVAILRLLKYVKREKKMIRFIAVLVLFIPGIIGAFGIKLMRDALFSEVYTIFFNEGIQFVVGLIFFISGLAFIGGFIYHRDKKRNLVKKDSGTILNK